jgi:hypothetical protein
MIEVAKISYAKPVSGVTVQQVQEYKQKAIKLLENMIRKKGKKPEDFIVRDVLPKTDLGLTNEEWSISYSAAYTEEEKINKTLGDDEFLVIYGYANDYPTPKTLYIKLTRGSVPIKIIHTQAIHLQEIPIGFFEPEGWAEGETIKVAFYGNATGTDRPILLSLWAEPKEKTISP